jgi:hypothetical protein
MDDLYETAKKKMGIFMPETAKRQKNFEQSNNLFVHYTSASNVVNILRNKQLWMRNVQVMNDFSEIRHGIQQVTEFLGSELAHNLIDSANKCHPEAWNLATERYNNWKSHLLNNTFLFCLSEHDPKEDEVGRLSMWRAYGGNSAKAAILIKFPFGHIQTGIAYEINFSPALYYSPPEIRNHFHEIAGSIAENMEYVRALGLEEIVRLIFVMLFITSISLKHPGFSEEREWRIVHVPRFFQPTPVKSNEPPLMRPKVEVIDSLPQSVYKINLENNSEYNITGIDIKDIIKKIIIGPTENPLVVYEALMLELQDAGFKDMNRLITASQIPLRT